MARDDHDFTKPVNHRPHVTLEAVEAIPEELRAAWDDLAKGAAEPNAFMERWFVDPALTHLRQHDTVWLLTARRDHELIGVMFVSLSNRYGRVPVKHVSNWQHYQSFMGTPLIRCGEEATVWRLWLRALDDAPWAAGFLTLRGLEDGGPVHQGLAESARTLGRPSPTVHRYERALLASGAAPDAYIKGAIRPKKRKELKRLQNRLAEIGTIAYSQPTSAQDVATWIEDFLTLEAAGWKGERGAALDNEAGTRAFFREMLAGAFARGQLDFLRMELDDRPVAMLVNFLTPPGAWSFKIAYDETLSRFSPGVMIELENLRRVLTDPALDWMDSCAVGDHPMINSLWRERRKIVQVSVPLTGMRRRAIYTLCRAAETLSARARALRTKSAVKGTENE
jgi:CelD/BcsL family acetyltransferase involved in cellulose biosynthesis